MCNHIEQGLQNELKQKRGSQTTKKMGRLMRLKASLSE